MLNRNFISRHTDVPISPTGASSTMNPAALSASLPTLSHFKHFTEFTSGFFSQENRWLYIINEYRSRFFRKKQEKWSTRWIMTLN